jgi:hypothetical protein
MQHSGAPPDRPSGRGWQVFFIVLIVLASAGAIVPFVFNLRQQLSAEELQEAQTRWKEYGPENYDLEYTIRFDDDPEAQRHVMLVRNGKVVMAALDGEPTYLDPAFGAAAGLCMRGVSQEPRPQGIESIFLRLEQALRTNAAAPRRNFTSAQFDANDGHPRRFVHRIRETGQREEWYLRVLPPGASRKSQ